MFQLIKAMTKGDRRNFKLFAQLQEGDKKYIQLFDAIEKQEEYDERLLLQQFEGERFTNQFSVAKNYLYRYILKTLHVFQKDPYSDLMTLVHQVRILMSKNLYEQAHKLLRKAIHQAEAVESFTSLLELYQMEREIYHFSQKMGEYSVFVKDIQDKEKEAQQKLINLSSYIHIQDQTKLIIKRIREAKGKKGAAPFQEIWDNPLIQSDQSAISIRAKIKRLSLMEECAANEGRYAESLKHSIAIVELFEQNEAIRETDNLLYLLELSNLSIHYYQNKLTDKAFATLDKLRNATFISQQEEIRLFEKTAQITLVMAIEQGNMEEGKKAAQNIEETLQNLDGKIRKSAEMVLYFNLTYFWLMAGNYSEGLRWSNRFLNEPRQELQGDQTSMARVLNAILHYELGHYDLLEYTIKSAFRFIYKHDRLFKFETLALRTIKRLTEATEESGKREILLEAEKELKEVVKDPYELRSSNMFDFGSWLAAKINHTRFVDEKRKTSHIAQKEKVSK